MYGSEFWESQTETEQNKRNRWGGSAISSE